MAPPLFLAPFFLSLVVGLSAQAAELPESWTSARALGMGNAFTAVATEGDALFYNPAALARVSGFHWTIMDPKLGVNGVQAMDVARTISSNGSNADKINDLYGKTVWLGGSAKSSFVLPGFGIAGFATGDGGINLQNPAYPQMNLNYFFDYGVAVGAAFDFVPGIWSIGATFKRINRTGTSFPLGASTLATLDSSVIERYLKSRGTGYGLDAGMLITLPSPVRPALALTVRNAGYTTFTHEEGEMAPPRSDPDVTFGASFTIDTPIVTVIPSFDYRYIERSDIQTGKKLHMGLEIELPVLTLRAGLNQGYYSLGVGMDFGVLEFNAATYGVELGEYPGQLEDRRYLAQMTIQLGLDGFGFGGSSSSSGDGSGGGSGSRRRLKQRR